MEFVTGCIEDAEDQRYQRNAIVEPASPPTECPVEQDPQNRIFRKVGTFADQKINLNNHVRREEVIYTGKQGAENTANCRAGGFRRSGGGGHQKDKNQPENQGKRIAHELVAEFG